MQGTPEALQASVRTRFAAVATAPGRERKFPVGPGSAKSLGYDAGEIDGLPSGATESFCGVGNPLGLGTVAPGWTVLDLGCGAGMDAILLDDGVTPGEVAAKGEWSD